MYKVYVRWSDQRITDRTVTPAPPEAERAFRALLARSDLDGQACAAILTLNNRQLNYSRFDRSLSSADRMGPNNPVGLFE